MRFIYESELEKDLINEHNKIEKLTFDLISMFDESDFDKTIQINGLNFSNRYKNIYASFFVDSKLNYKGYVTNDETNESNYSVKGNIDNVISAADDIIDMFYSEIDK